MSKKRQNVDISALYAYEAGVEGAVADLHLALFCEYAPDGMTVAALVAKIRAAWIAGDVPCWEG